MLTLSTDGPTAEKQMRAVIFYLTTFGYIDGTFDPAEQRVTIATLRPYDYNRLCTNGGTCTTPGAPDQVRYDDATAGGGSVRSAKFMVRRGWIVCLPPQVVYHSYISRIALKPISLPSPSIANW